MISGYANETPERCPAETAEALLADQIAPTGDSATSAQAGYPVEWMALGCRLPPVATPSRTRIEYVGADVPRLA